MLELKKLFVQVANLHLENAVKMRSWLRGATAGNETCTDLLELLDSFVLEHVAAQVGFPRETATAVCDCALTRALFKF